MTPFPWFDAVIAAHSHAAWTTRAPAMMPAGNAGTPIATNPAVIPATVIPPAAGLIMLRSVVVSALSSSIIIPRQSAVVRDVSPPKLLGQAGSRDGAGRDRSRM